MKGFDRNISSFDAAFEQTPKVFQSVSMDVPFGVRLSVIDYVVNIFIVQFVVRAKLVGNYFRPFSTCSRTCVSRSYLAVPSTTLTRTRECFSGALRSSNPITAVLPICPPETLLCPLILLSLSLCIFRASLPIHVSSASTRD